ncbi:MAG: right-handed parallel beta-helix repeat-containing protein, partial [Planctomycetales bacterium]|nr:right-handed parallel beta-helix repeat-containing protein [Planctomycetales bacterium]
GINADNQVDLLISDNTILGNGRGIIVNNVFSSGQTLIDNNQIAYSNGDGLDVSFGTTVHGNAVHDNAFFGIDVDRDAVIDQNVVFGNVTGIRAGNYSYGGSIISGNRIYANDLVGIDTYRNNIQRQNTIYSNPIGIRTNSSAGGFSGEIDRNLIYDSAQFAILIRNGVGADVTGNTIYSEAGSTGLRMEQTTYSSYLRNNIFVSVDSTALSFATDSQNGIDSDFNLFQTAGTGNVAIWQATPRTTLTAWRNAAFTDPSSLEQDPLFVDPLGGDGVLGFVDLVKDGRDDDFHLRSTAGRFTGSLAPVFDVASGRATMLPSIELTDAQQSPSIDRGDASFPFAAEPTPNGGFINQGAYGNSALASKSPAQYVLVVVPDGGEVWFQNQAFDVTWRSDILGPATDVDITLLKDGDAGFSLLIGDDVPNTGTFNWIIPGSVVPDTDYRIRVTRNDQPALNDDSGAPFTISEPISNYYVAVDGDDANSGLSLAQPKASIKGILEAYDLGSGDTVIVGPGTYAVDSNILLVEQDSGVVIRGTTDVDGTPLTILNRGNTANGSYVFQLGGGDDIILESLYLTGAYRGIYGSTSADSDRLTVRGSTIAGNVQEQIWIQTSSDDLTVENSTIVGLGNTYTGIRVESDNAIIRGSQVSYAGDGIGLTGYHNLVEDNRVFQNFYQGIDIARSSDTGSIVRNNQVYSNGYGIYITSNNAVVPTLVTGNDAFGNANTGIYGAYNVLVTGNTVWQNLEGIDVTNDAVAENNIAYENSFGLSAGDYSYNATLRNNVAFNNDVGLRGHQSALIQGNTAYSNRIGILHASSSTSRVQTINNLIYDNTDAGIRVEVGRSGTLIRNNTLYEPTASAIKLAQASSNIKLRNNIIEVHDAYAYDVDADSQNGFGSDYNLIYAPAAGKLALWGSSEFDTRADWVSEVGFDFHSRFGEQPSDAPGFVDPDGIDDILGYSNVSVGPELIIDDGDTDFSVIGTSSPGIAGYGGDSTNMGSTSVAQWQFGGLTPGATYEISVTFPSSGYTSYANYSFIDAGGLISSSTISQYYRALGTTNPLWLPLTQVTVGGDFLTVQLQGEAGTTNADAIRIREIVGNGSADDNFLLRPDSAAIDGGSLDDTFGGEPAHDGRRINLGHTGGTDQTSPSADDVVQVLSPRGLEKITVGETFDIQWHTAGNWVNPKADVDYQGTVTASSAIAHWTLGETSGTTAVDRIGGYNGTLIDSPELGNEGVFGPGRDAAMTFDGASGYVSVPDAPALNPATFSVSAWVYAGSGISTYDSVVTKMTGTGFNDGFGIYYYSGDLNFFVNQYDLNNDAQGPITLNRWTHIAATFDGDTARLYIDGELAGQRSGLTIDPSSAPLEIGRARNNGYIWNGGIDEVAFYDTVLSPQSIVGLANPRPFEMVDIDLIDVATGTVATSIADDLNAAGVYSWTVPGTVVSDREYRVRISSSGNNSIVDESYEPFQIVNDGTDYYVNDGDLSGDVYTTAIGSNYGSGKSPDSPMASLPALLAAYDLEPGDRIYVDGGTYSISKNLVIGAEDSGVTIIGTQPTVDVPNPTPTVLDRDNTSTGTIVIQLSNADDITLDSVVLRNAYNAIYASSTSDSDGFVLRNSRIEGMTERSIYLLATNDDVTIENSVIDGTSTVSSIALVRIDGADSVVVGNELFGGYRGIEFYGGGHLLENNTFNSFTNYAASQNSASDAPVIFRNNRFVDVNSGIYVTRSTNLSPNTIEGNVVTNFVSYGINASGNVAVTGNQVSISTGINAIGIRGDNGTVIDSNIVFQSQYGISVGSYTNSGIASNNRVYLNEIAGIQAYYYSTVASNKSYNNTVGVEFASSSGGNHSVAHGNIVYDNTDAGFKLINGGSGSQIINNTISQTVGTGIRLTQNSWYTDIRNNIIEVFSGPAFTIDSSSQYQIKSDFNVIHTPAAGTLGLWEDIPFDDQSEWYHQLGLDQHSIVGDTSLSDPMFVDPDGPDNRRGFSEGLIGSPIVIDDGDAGFATTSNWNTVSTGGYGGDYLTGPRVGSDIPTATWTFSGLQGGGTYKVAATWGTGTYSTTADYHISDPTGRLAVVRKSQFNLAPDDFVDGSVPWENLGTFTITGDKLTVVLYADDVNRETVADAIRIQRIFGDTGADDDFHIELASPAVDAGEFSDVDIPRLYLDEPLPNGSRVNAGAFGGTDQATISADATISLVTPGNFEKIKHGETVDISWQVSGTAVLVNEAQTTFNHHASAGPLAYWRLDETGGTAVSDATGNGFDGTVVGNVDLNAEGVFGPGGTTSLGLVQDNGYVEVPHNDMLNAPQFSIEVWVRAADNLSTYDSVISKTTSTGWSDGFGMYQNGGTLYFFVNQFGTAVGANPRVVLPKDRWMHIVGTYDGVTAKLYADGQWVGEQLIDAPLKTNTAPLEIGRGRHSSYTWKGMLDEVAMYSRALSADEIKGLSSITPESNVDIDLIDVVSGTITPIATGITADGHYVWDVPGDIPAPGDYRIRITSNDPSGASDTTMKSFQIVPAGTEYFINDGSFIGDVYTTATGNNSNDGRSPATPMADLRALIQAYDLGPGDTVFVDTGDYELLRNIYLDQSDSGVTITGPVGAATATLDRDNPLNPSRAIQLTGADDVTLQHLSITGGYVGLYASAGADSDRITVSNVEIFNHAFDQVFIDSSNDYMTIVDSRIYDSDANADGIEIHSNENSILRNEIFGHQYGIYSPVGGGSQFVGNQVYDNSQYGLYLVATVAGVPEQRVVGNHVYANATGMYVVSSGNNAKSKVLGNVVENNTTYGIYANSGVDVESNQVLDNPSTGIYLIGDATATGNVVHGNGTGILAGHFSANGYVYSNRVYDNSVVGIHAYRASNVIGNYVYANSVGIHVEGSTSFRYAGDVFNNLVYSNTNQGILADVTGSGAELVGNTIFQPVGEAIRFTGASRDTRVYNNAIRIDSGHAIFVEPGNTTGQKFDRNIYLQGTDPNAHVGHWAGTTADGIVDWQTASGGDQSSWEADPDFIDIDGADNVIGFDPLADAGNGYDGGRDDNFIVRKNSPTIDRGDGYFATKTDIQGSPRLDDPDTINGGKPEPAESDLGSSLFNPAGGVAQNWRSYGATWQYTLPFTFNYLGVDYASVWVGANGLLQFGTSVNAGDTTNSTAELDDYPRIAGLWDTIRTTGPGDDIFIDTTVADQVTIRWDATKVDDSSDINFAVTLFAGGEVEFHYGSGNTNLSPTIGFGGTEGRHFDVQPASIDGASTLAGANSLHFDLTPGSVDIGAYEFRGESSDVTPPQVVQSSPAAVENQSITTLGIDSIGIIFSEEVNNIDAAALAAYDLRASGTNGLFGDGDDIVFSVLPAFTLGNDFVTLDIASGFLPPGDYRLRIPSGLSRSIHDTAGLRLDGDGDGIEGGDFERFFTVAINTQPTADPQSVTATEDVELPIMLTGDDGDPAIVQGLSYWLTSLPTNGVLSTSPGGTPLLSADLPIQTNGQLYFTPAQDSVAPDGFDFYVQDDGSTANGGVDTSSAARLTISITPVNDAPRDVALLGNLLTENIDTATGDVLVSDFTVVDPDVPDSHTFELASGAGDVDNGRFLISGGTLYLKQNETVDYETAPSYQIRVAAIDAIGDRVERPLTIDVLNLPEIAMMRYDQNGLGNDQRSMLRGVTVVFDQIVSANAAAFEIVKLGIANPIDAMVDFNVIFADVGGQTEATFTFTGSHLQSNGMSLVDGNYRLTALGSQIIATASGISLDGDQDGLSGGNAVIGDREVDAFFRLFGDTDGDRDIDAQDYGRFALAFNKHSGDPEYDPAFDFNLDGDVDGQDYGNFERRFLRQLPF